MEIWIVRHGETDWNLDQRVQGWSDIPLNATGMNQAEQLAQQLQDIRFDRIYSSDLSRAMSTAARIALGRDATVIPDIRLRERRKGEAEGVVFDDIPERFPDGIAGEESDAELEERLFAALHDIGACQTQAERVLCVSHGGSIRKIAEVLGRKDLPYIHNGSITRLASSQDGWTILGINETCQEAIQDAQQSRSACRQGGDTLL
ncbi:MAG: histidine phosphatase family protein [Alicyclobacillaceae bacterium]|nr:histidine phosphatase family protein [Alicyclobacillaceae bacterium]